MNWLVFGVTAYVLLSMQVGLQPLLQLGGIVPSLMLVLLVFVGLLGSPLTVGFVALLLGTLVDLVSASVPGGPVVGPHAIGFLVGAYALLQMRSLLFRESVLTVVIMTPAVGFFVQIAIVTLLAMRQVPFLTAEPIAGWELADQVFTRFWTLVYSTVLAVPLGAALMRMRAAYGFAKSDRKY